MDEHQSCPNDGVALVHLDTSANARAQDLIGEVVDGRYRIERIVGRGGMGTVYACSHVVVGKQFAMKVLRPDIERSEEILQRFIREAQAANAVRSRHICEMTDFGQLSNGAFYIVMDLLQGQSLTRALRSKSLDRRSIKHVFIQIADTLERAHQAGIVHRDLKPDNVVLIQDEDDPHFVKLVDFGIAKIMESKASNLTETGVILGTPYYMSPEQARGEGLDHRSDIYALGVMMYRAFTGQLPFVADTAMGVLTRHLTEKPELPSRLAEMDHALEQLILRCLEKKPIDRFQSMANVVDALQALPDQLVRPNLSHPTMDERSGGLPVSRPPQPHAKPAPRRQSATPTRVATPQAKSIRQGATGHAASTSVPAAPRIDGRPRSQFPPPMPAPPPPSEPTHAKTPISISSGAHAASMGTPSSGQHPSMPSGPAALPPAMRSPHISAMPMETHPPSLNVGSASSNESLVHLDQEAATGRAVVSSRIRTRSGISTPRVALFGGVLVLATGAFIMVAISVLSGDRGPSPAGSTSQVTSDLAATTGSSTPHASSADPTSPDAGVDAEHPAVQSSAAPATSAKPATTIHVVAPKPTGGSKPSVEPEDNFTKPMPEIRSPFE